MYAPSLFKNDIFTPTKLLSRNNTVFHEEAFVFEELTPFKSSLCYSTKDNTITNSRQGNKICNIPFIEEKITTKKLFVTKNCHNKTSWCIGLEGVHCVVFMFENSIFTFYNNEIRPASQNTSIHAILKTCRVFEYISVYLGTWFCFVTSPQMQLVSKYSIPCSQTALLYQQPDQYKKPFHMKLPFIGQDGIGTTLVDANIHHTVARKKLHSGDSVWKLNWEKNCYEDAPISFQRVCSPDYEWRLNIRTEDMLSTRLNKCIFDPEIKDTLILGQFSDKIPEKTLKTLSDLHLLSQVVSENHQQTIVTIYNALVAFATQEN